MTVTKEELLQCVCGCWGWGGGRADLNPNLSACVCYIANRAPPPAPPQAVGRSEELCSPLIRDDTVEGVT